MKGKRIEIPLEELIVQRVKAENPRTVRDLFETIRRRRPTLTEQEFIEKVKELRDGGVLELELPPPNVSSYPGYFAVRDENAWFYLTALASAATVLAIYVIPTVYPISIFRWVVGSIFVLFLPGFVTVQALFPGRELDGIERLALSVGLSLAITPLIGLLLNYTPWGIRLDPITVSLSLYTIGIGALGTYRKYRAALARLKAGSATGVAG